MKDKELFNLLINLNGRCTDALEEYVYQVNKDNVGLDEVKNQIEEVDKDLEKINKIIN